MAALTISFGEAPPTEFRIFSVGKNETTKGTFLFDDAAARAVMAAYQQHGNDVMIDLEHMSLDDQGNNYDPDARGWAKLELRNGELWASGVTWTADGGARLTEKRQRYVSPAFLFDSKTGRITQLLNIAITAMPATNDLQPLVAASRRQTLTVGQEGNVMTPEQFSALAEALGLGADANVEDVLATVAGMVKKIQDAANGTAPEGDGGGGAAADVPAAAAAAPPVVAAARVSTGMRVLARLTGKKEIGAVVQEIEAWKKSHVTLEEQTAQLARDRSALEGNERRRLVGELVKLGAEIPATAWADDEATKPAEPWASMPMESLRSRVVKLAKSKGATTTTTTRQIQPAAGAGAAAEGGQAFTFDGESVEVTASELATCSELKAKPEDYARNKLVRLRAQRARKSA